MPPKGKTYFGDFIVYPSIGDLLYIAVKKKGSFHCY